MNPHHIINVGRHREFWAMVDDVVAAIVARGDIRKRGHDLIYDGEILTPRALRGYLAMHCVFHNGKTQKRLSPWPIVHAVLSRAHNGYVPVRTEGAP